MILVEFLAVGIGGFLGSCLRYFLTKVMANFAFTFPFATLFSNVIAGIAIGFIIGLEQQSVVISPKMKLFLSTGLLGGLSTFSTFSLETVNFIMDKRYFLATGNVILNLGLSLLGVILGMTIAKAIKIH